MYTFSFTSSSLIMKPVLIALCHAAYISSSIYLSNSYASAASRRSSRISLFEFVLGILHTNRKLVRYQQPLARRQFVKNPKSNTVDSIYWTREWNIQNDLKNYYISTMDFYLGSRAPQWVSPADIPENTVDRISEPSTCIQQAAGQSSWWKSDMLYGWSSNLYTHQTIFNIIASTGGRPMTCSLRHFIRWQQAERSSVNHWRTTNAFLVNSSHLSWLFYEKILLWPLTHFRVATLDGQTMDNTVVAALFETILRIFRIVFFNCS